MSAKGRQQCLGEIRIEMQVLMQFRQAQELGLLVGAAQPERRFAPMLDL